MKLPILLALNLLGIVGGVPTDEDRDCVAVGRIDPGTKQFKLLSSGVLVSTRVVLTMDYVARGGDDAGPLVVAIGSDIGTPRATARVGRVEVHPDSRPGSGAFAALILDRDVPADVARPRRIAPAALVDSAKVLRIIGFGSDDAFGAIGVGVKRRADVPITIANCAESAESRERYGCKAGEIVAVDPQGKDAAAGDSGGPACVADGGEWLLAAIIDRSVKDAARPSGDGGVYIRVDKYASWIRERIDERSDPSAPVGPAPRAPGRLTPHVLELSPRALERAAPAAAAAAPSKQQQVPSSPTAGVGGVGGLVARQTRSILKSPTYKGNARLQSRAIVVRGRVAGGSNTREFPDCVAVADGQGEYFATGTLVAPRVVLTAGHAFDRGFSKVLIGDDYQVPSSATPPIEVIKAVIHPQYGSDSNPDRPTFVNDLTVLILERAVKPGEARPRAIAEEADVLAAVTGMVVGFGSTGDLTIPNAGAGRKRGVEIPLASYACDKNVDGVAETDAFGCVSDRELVAADPLRRKDSCEGDSGGPLYVKRDGAWFLAGATSRGTKRNGDDLDANGLPLICGLGGIYVRVDKYKDWIREVAKANNVDGP